MNLLIYLFITILLVFLFFNILPFLAPILIVLFLVNVLRQFLYKKQFKSDIESTSFYENDTHSKQSNQNVIDVEYTEREDDGE